LADRDHPSSLLYDAVFLPFRDPPHPPRTCFDCRIAGRALRHEPPSGSLAICPAGVDCSADAGGDVEAILVAIDPQRLALAAADGAVLETRLVERFSGYDDVLLALADRLTRECALGFPDGPLFWNETASHFIETLLSRHTDSVVAPRGMLGNDVLMRLRDYVVEHLHEPIEVAALAKVAGRSPFHFSRVFSRSVGVTPHRYVVHLRLRRAIELVREGRASLAQIAVRTGFADQSHLSRRVRRGPRRWPHKVVNGPRAGQQDSSRAPDRFSPNASPRGSKPGEDAR
jgi:AraC family transcriptional regulator